MIKMNNDINFKNGNYAKKKSYFLRRLIKLSLIIFSLAALIFLVFFIFSKISSNTISIRDIKKAWEQYDYEKDILASLRSDGNNVKSFYSYNDGVLTVNDYDRGVVKTIDCSRDENGNFSIQEKPMYIDERKKGYEQLGWDFEETKYGTFFRNISEYAGGTFMKTDGTKDTAFSGGRLYDQNYVGKVTLNGLAKTTATTYTAQTIDGSNGWGLKGHSIYDFKNSQYREDLEDLIDLGRKFYAVKKIGEKQFGIYEMADETMKNPLIMVDSCHLTNTNNYSGNTKNEYCFCYRWQRVCGKRN